MTITDSYNLQIYDRSKSPSDNWRYRIDTLRFQFRKGITPPAPEGQYKQWTYVVNDHWWQARKESTSGLLIYSVVSSKQLFERTTDRLPHRTISPVFRLLGVQVLDHVQTTLSVVFSDSSSTRNCCESRTTVSCFFGQLLYSWHLEHENETCHPGPIPFTERTGDNLVTYDRGKHISVLQFVQLW